jgi:hypothetical protein
MSELRFNCEILCETELKSIVVNQAAANILQQVSAAWMDIGKLENHNERITRLEERTSLVR